MIELKNISKTYKSKKSTNTSALKNISIKFPEKGMVFILGKSGSGKSTLLNILGGLDNYDEGELIINGKSTKKFSQSEFDSYRNTYVGFIFQDFNLLDKYTVVENISLSLQLQGIKPTKEKISEIMNLVELTGLEKRKINELSGGQQQRVSIARALIKNPNIILADEPTGNLDSETGKQIFNLLKKLSKDKLIVIVSHDDESTEKYADRIIEIKDGAIINDTNKIEDIENKEKFRLVKAKLPFKYGAKLGIGNLKHKKIKLFFTIIFLTISAILLGITLSANSFDIEQEHLNSLISNNCKDVSLYKYDDVVNYYELQIKNIKRELMGKEEEEEEIFPNAENFTDNEINNIENNTKVKWVKYNTLYQDGKKVELSIVKDDSINISDKKIYYSQINNYGYIELSNENDVVREKVLGRLPTTKDEIAISNFLADLIINSGVTAIEDGKNYTYKPSNYSQLITDGKEIVLDGYKNIKIVGIIEYDLSQFNEFKNVTYEIYNKDTSKYDNIFQDLTQNVYEYSKIFVTSEFFGDLKENYIDKEENYIKYNEKEYIIPQFGYISSDMEIYDGVNVVTINSLNDNEVIITTSVLDNITNGDYQVKLNEYLTENYEVTDYTDFTKQYIKNNGIIGKTIKSSINNNKNVKGQENYKEYIIKGVKLKENEEMTIFYSKNNVNKLVKEAKGASSIYALVNNDNNLTNICHNFKLDDSNILLDTKYSEGYISSQLVVKLLQKYGIYGIMISLLFAMLLFINFISNGISFRKKEIGILRAIGCRSNDVVKIFSIESLVVTAVVLIISIPIVIKIVELLNGIYAKYFGRTFEIFKFGIIQILGLIAVEFIIAIIINVVAVKKIARKKPIDAILNK